MEEDLLDALLGPIEVPVIPPKRIPVIYTIDTKTLHPHPARRCYGGYIPPRPRDTSGPVDVHIDTSERDYQEMIEDMTRLSLERMRGLQTEKRFARYERKKKASK